MTSDILEKLKAPFDPNLVHFRLGSVRTDKTKAMGLAYIDARDVMERLDYAVGSENWQRRYPHAAAKTCCEVSIRFGDTWVTKADGAGDTDIEGSKGAFSDSFKRAAVNWGIGRYLYDLPSPWVEIQPQGRSFKFTDSGLAQLRRELKAHTKEVGHDFSVDTTQAKKSSSQAKKDGDWERLKGDIESHHNPDSLKEWRRLNEDSISALPERHRKELFEIYMEQLKTATALNPEGFDGSSD